MKRNQKKVSKKVDKKDRKLRLTIFFDTDSGPSSTRTMDRLLRAGFRGSKNSIVFEEDDEDKVFKIMRDSHLEATYQIEEV